MVRKKTVFYSCKHLEMYRNKIKRAETIQSRALIKLVHVSLEVALQFVSFLRNNNAKSRVSNACPENCTLY